MNKPWYEIKAAAADAAAAGVRSAEVFIYGNIGDRWDENSITAANFVRDLQLLPADTITVRINSFGGSVSDGLAIHNALTRHPATIDVQVDGLAVSIASLIAMAGDTVTMADNALMMIHAPWGAVAGNAVDLRAAADMLDRYAQAMATSYAKKCKKTVAEVMPLLEDGKDHWMTAAEAQAAGFCDAVGPAADISASFDLSRFTPPAAAAVFSRKETVMPGTQSAAPAVPASAPQAAAPAATTPAFARNKEQNAEILAIFDPFRQQDGVAALERDVLADPAITVADASARLLKKIGEKQAPVNPPSAAPRIETLVDERDKWHAAASEAILVRAGLADKTVVANVRANPLRGYRLTDLARACLERANVAVRGMSQMDIVGAAFTQSTSDFPILLENTIINVSSNDFFSLT
jgi:ATP-dependent protease ClpP protease subunit